MHAIHLRGRDVRLPENVLVAVEGISKAAPMPQPQPPQWLARVLPGVQWSATSGDDPDDDTDDDDLDDDTGPSRRAELQEVSFEVPAGGGLGLVGDPGATKTLLKILIGFSPPSTGRIVVRGRIAPLLRFSDMNLSGEFGKSSLKVISRFLGWPRDFLSSRWDEIVDFARLEELEEFGFPRGSVEYEAARTKRLLLSAIMHLDATVYVVLRNFAGTDAAMYERCCEILEQRQREGCAIIEAGRAPEDVAMFCHEAILFENGAPVFRGRLGEVASAIAERGAVKQKQQRRLALRALLASEDAVVTLGPEGGRIEIELDVFKPVNARLAIRFTDEQGTEMEVEYGEPFEGEPGIYRLGIVVPGGVLGDGAYDATLLGARESADASEPPTVQELLSFAVVSQDSDVDAEGVQPEFGLLPDDDEQAGPQDVEWHVRRVET